MITFIKSLAGIVLTATTYGGLAFLLYAKSVGAMGDAGQNFLVFLLSIFTILMFVYAFGYLLIANNRTNDIQKFRMDLHPLSRIQHSLEDTLLKAHGDPDYKAKREQETVSRRAMVYAMSAVKKRFLKRFADLLLTIAYLCIVVQCVLVGYIKTAILLLVLEGVAVLAGMVFKEAVKKAKAAVEEETTLLRDRQAAAAARAAGTENAHRVEATRIA